MLHHVSVGVADVERAAAFYDPVLATLGYKRVMEILPYAIGYGGEGPQFWIGRPANQLEPTFGNGAHVAFNAGTKDAIDAFHRAALEAGGTDEGGAGPRPDYGPDYFCAFVRDFDGNKLEAVLMPEPPPQPARAAASKPRAPAKKKTAAKKKTKAKTKTAKRGKKTAKRPAKTAQSKAKKARGKKTKRRR